MPVHETQAVTLPKHPPTRVRQLVLCGLLTDQCVESAVRDACDLGYLVTLVTDGCATITRERHENSLRAIRGYCRQTTVDALLAEIAGSSSRFGT